MALSHSALSSAATGDSVFATHSSGLLVLDANSRAVSWNYEFLQIMSYPDLPSPRADARALVATYVRRLLQLHGIPSSLLQSIRIISGQRHYTCRAFPLSHGPRYLVIMLERLRTALPPVAAISQQYALTAREEQVLQCVLEGLSNKEAALRLQISPNTVKVFIRLVMMKMKVSSRSAILSRVLSFPSAA